MQNVILNNGVEMPILGFAVFQIEDRNCSSSKPGRNPSFLPTIRES
ncbi:hypothetical protein [Paenibacillus sp. Marseille-Q7038]